MQWVQRLTLPYGIVELIKGTRFDNDRAFGEIKKQCLYFKSEKCIAPENFIAYMQLPPPRHIILKHAHPHTMLNYLLNEVTQELIDHLAAKKLNKFGPKNNNTDISEIMTLIRETWAQSESELTNIMKI